VHIPAADRMDVDTQRLDSGRRQVWRFVIIATLVVVAVLLGALWWDQRGFDPGNTLQVTASIAECGYVHIDVGGEEWQSAEPRPGNGQGAIMSGSLERISEDEALYRESDGAPGLLMVRIGSGRFWPVGGCIEPDI
jgi:hypothetical protein